MFLGRPRHAFPTANLWVKGSPIRGRLGEGDLNRYFDFTIDVLQRSGPALGRVRILINLFHNDYDSVTFHHQLLCMNSAPGIANVFKHVSRRRC